MNISDVYDYIKQMAPNYYGILKLKIDEFYGEGIEPIRLYNMVSQLIPLKKYCRALDIENGDYIDFIKAIKIATFLKAKFDNEDAVSIMQKTLIYDDNNICIFKPTNFQESSIVGEPICCFAFSQGRWDEHYNGYDEAIYYVYDVMRENTLFDFVAITVRPSGRALVLDKEHNWWTPQDSIQYIQALEDGASYITTKDGRTIKTENKQHMKRKIRLTEGDLRRIVNRSVRRVLKEAVTQQPCEQYYWSISRIEETEGLPGEYETIECYEDSHDSKDAKQEWFITPDEAYEDGLRILRLYNDGDFSLEVYCEPDNIGEADYVSGYYAEIHDGRLKEY